MTTRTARRAAATRRSMEPVVQESTPSMIASRVREAIASGHIAPGSQLGEANLARELGVSRGPLREGLQRLTAEGLLISIRNRGLFVIEMTPERVQDMYLARQAVERAAAERIHDGDPVAAGGALMGVIEVMARARSARGEGVADIEFHQLLVSLAASPRLSRMHEILMTETRMCIHALADSYVHGDAVRVEEHTAIARSFLDRDARLTDELLAAHMTDAVRRLTAGRSTAPPSSSA
ncbi:GntR family transcriptional regulator [Ornithinimicrobium cavernae]|uniref:GntR family transcriptional regulator n=1 Tax=Ornithinimicrobium cavernae TaxID=2666047 RepID=UPI000D6946EB|nr:GntR family transcriptional regulator [Ornithinimicrobium cavernae]